LCATIVRGAETPVPQRRKARQQADQTVPLVLRERAARCLVVFIVEDEQILHHFVGTAAAAKGVDASVQITYHIGLLNSTVAKRHFQLDEAMERVFR